MMLILLTGIAVRDEARHQRVAALMVGDRLALLGVHHPTALLEPADHALDRGFEVREGDPAGIAAGRQEGGLVDDVGQIRAAEARRETRGALEIEIRRQRDPLAVDAQNLHAAGEIGIAQDHLAIEPARRAGARGRAPLVDWWPP